MHYAVCGIHSTIESCRHDVRLLMISLISPATLSLISLLTTVYDRSYEDPTWSHLPSHYSLRQILLVDLMTQACIETYLIASVM